MHDYPGYLVCSIILTNGKIPCSICGPYELISIYSHGLHKMVYPMFRQFLPITHP